MAKGNHMPVGHPHGWVPGKWLGASQIAGSQQQGKIQICVEKVPKIVRMFAASFGWKSIVSSHIFLFSSPASESRGTRNVGGRGGIGRLWRVGELGIVG